MKTTTLACASFVSATVLAAGCGGKDPPPQQPNAMYGQPGDPNKGNTATRSSRGSTRRSPSRTPQQPARPGPRRTPASSSSPPRPLLLRAASRRAGAADSRDGRRRSSRASAARGERGQRDERGRRRDRRHGPRGGRAHPGIHADAGQVLHDSRAGLPPVAELDMQLAAKPLAPELPPAGVSRRTR